MRKVYFLLIALFFGVESFGQLYYRSAATGDWGVTSTWESSSDNLSWAPAASIPTSADNTITIRNGHTVTITTSVTADEIIIGNGGTLDYTGGVFTIDEGSGNDVEIQSGGVFILSLASTTPTFSGGTSIVDIKGGGTLRVSAPGLTNAALGINSSNFVYEHQSILEYTLNGAFASIGVTFFPNVNATTIPIFRTTNTSNILVGSNTFTTFNGIFECAGTGDVIWQNTGIKTFRNGIRGTGNCTANVSAASAKFIINGISAELGGSGSLVVPTTGGLEIGSPTTVTMTSDKTVTGNITLLNANSLIELLNFNLTVSGTIGISQTSSYVKTNGTGKLTLNNITAFPGKLFPIGLSTVNPLYITSTSPSNYSARVVEPITPPIYNDIQAVLRTWYISSSVNTPGASISFGYTFNLTECGPLYNNAGPVEVGVNISNIWNVHQSGLIPMAFPIVPGTFVVTPGAVISYFNNPVNEFPFVVANNGAILPLDYFITARAQKRNNNGDISWKILETAGILNFEVQRSVNNSAFSTLATFTPTDNQFDYNYIDAALQAGTNLYRIRVNRSIGSIRYSNTVAVLNGANGLLITGLAPNPVHDNALLTISAAKPATVQFQLYNMYGSMIRQWNAAVAEGTNTIPVNTAGIPTGIYQLTAMGSGGKAQFRLVKQ